MQNNNDNFSLIDVLTIFSVMLQITGLQNDLSQSSNDDLMRELQKQDKAYLDKIIENQNRILGILSEIKQDMSAD